MNALDQAVLKTVVLGEHRQKAISAKVGASASAIAKSLTRLKKSGLVSLEPKGQRLDAILAITEALSHLEQVVAATLTGLAEPAS